MTYGVVQVDPPYPATKIVDEVSFVRSITCWYETSLGNVRCYIGFDDQLTSSNGFRVDNDKVTFYLPACTALWVVKTIPAGGTHIFYAVVGGVS